jgi:hypothetical protein
MNVLLIILRFLAILKQVTFIVEPLKIVLQYIEVSQHNNFLTLIKQNRHYCVHIRFYCAVGIRYMFRPPLLGHLQALSITIIGY